MGEFLKIYSSFFQHLLNRSIFRSHFCNIYFSFHAYITRQNCFLLHFDTNTVSIMSISNTAVIGVFITIFGLMILLSVTLFATITCCCYAYVEENDKNTPGRLKFGLMSPLRTAPSRFGGIHANQVISGPVDLENQLHQVKSYNAPNNTRISPLSSQIVLNSFPISNANQNKSHSNHNTNTSKDNIQHCNTLEYESAVEKFDNMTEGLFDDLKQNPNLRRAHLETIARRMSFIHYKRDGSNNIQTVLARPSEKKQNYISDQYDSFSRTLMLQSLIQDLSLIHI